MICRAWPLVAISAVHQGLIGGAVTGKIVSQLAAGLPPVIDPAPFRADRF
ncbi:hypothetical protein [Mesorhizobium sp. ES1-4]|nr:hypothetical protein [Mesorhizobium sp. ES1-4]MBZ9797298.1 hypothetical protein [Mesorhizobium sp. ES1-4]